MAEDRSGRISLAGCRRYGPRGSQEGGLEMSAFCELVARPGVLMAGRFGPDGRVAEHETTSLYIENPAMAGMAHWFCAAVTTMFGAMAYAVDALTQASFSQTSWLPVRSWTFTGGDYVVVVDGDRFVITERAKLGSLDELSRPLHAGGS